MRKIEWHEERMSTYHGEVVDYVGMLGKLKAFTLYQCVGDKGFIDEWKMTSHFIPSKARNSCYRKPEDGKRACESIVENFARWLAG